MCKIPGCARPPSLPSFFLNFCFVVRCFFFGKGPSLRKRGGPPPPLRQVFCPFSPLFFSYLPPSLYALETVVKGSRSGVFSTVKDLSTTVSLSSLLANSRALVDHNTPYYKGLSHRVSARTSFLSLFIFRGSLPCICPSFPVIPVSFRRSASSLISPIGGV